MPAEPLDSPDLSLPQKLLQTSWQPCPAPAVPAPRPWGPTGTAQHHKSSCSEVFLRLTGCWQAFACREKSRRECWWRVRVSLCRLITHTHLCSPTEDEGDVLRTFAHMGPCCWISLEPFVLPSLLLKHEKRQHLCLHAGVSTQPPLSKSSPPNRYL